MEKSNLDRLLVYASNNGMERLEKDFKRGRSHEDGLNGTLRDYSKEYDLEKKIIYYYKYKFEKGIDGPVGISDEESFPYSFDRHLKEEIRREKKTYLNWLKKLFEEESAEKTQAIIRNHKSKIDLLINEITGNETPPRATLKEVYTALVELESHFPSKATHRQQREEIHEEDIYTYYFRSLIGKNLKRSQAFHETKNWLFKELKFTEAQVKERFRINLEEDNFIRNANNRTHLRNRISQEFSEQEKNG